MQGREEKLTKAVPSYIPAANVRAQVWRIMKNRPRTANISHELRSTNRWNLKDTLATALLRQRRLHFLSYHGCLSAKGGILSIAYQELLLTLQPSPPGLDHSTATWHTSGG